MRVQLLEVAWMLKLSVTNKNSFPEKWKQTWASEGLSSPDSEFILFFLSVQMDDEPFNPDYVEVDRVLDISESTDENGEVLWSLPVISHGFDSLPLSQSWSHTCVCVCVYVQLVTLYLVKWCSLPYEESTWELKADIDQSKIEEYEHIAARTPNTKRVVSPPRRRRLCRSMCAWA